MSTIDSLWLELQNGLAELARQRKVKREAAQEWDAAMHRYSAHMRKNSFHEDPERHTQMLRERSDAKSKWQIADVHYSHRRDYLLSQTLPDLRLALGGWSSSEMLIRRGWRV